MGREDIAAHLSGHPLGLQQSVHAQPVHGGEEPFRFSDEGLLRVSFTGAQEHDEASDDGGHGAVAALGFVGQDGLDTGSVPERHPHACVYCQFLIQGQELAQEIQHSLVLIRTFRGRLLDSCECHLETSCDAIDHRPEGENQKFITAGEVVPHRANSQPRLVSYFPQGCPFQAVAGNDPEDGLDNFMAPGFGINNFGHQ